MALHPRKKKRRRRMKKFTINELSAVDHPAQEGALMTIMKRDDDSEDIEKHSVPVMTTTEDGHSHLVWLSGDRGGNTSWQRSEGAETDHDHAWIIGDDGSMIIGESDGHTHTISSESLMAAMREMFIEDQDATLATIDVVFAQHESGTAILEHDFPIRCVSDLRNAIDVWGHAEDQDRAARNIEKRAREIGLEGELPNEGEFAESIAKAVGPVDGDHGRESEMTTRTKVAKEAVEDDAVKKTAGDGDALELEATRAKLEVAKSYGMLNDVQKTHFGTLDEMGQAAFLKKTPEQCEAEIREVHATREVVYKSLDGTEYTKSDDFRLITAVRQGDANAKELALAKAERLVAVYTKRAEEELVNLPGEIPVKVALLKAIDTIEDEDVRKDALKIVKAGNSEVAASFERKGLGRSGDAGSSDEKLTAMAKSYQEEHPGVDFYTAYTLVGESNPDLLAAAVHEK